VEPLETIWLRANTARQLLEMLDDLHWRGSPDWQRKLRLFACGIVRRVWDEIAAYPEARACVEFAELFVEGIGSTARLKRLHAANRAWLDRRRQRRGYDTLEEEVVRAAGDTCHPDAGLAARAFQSLTATTGGDYTPDNSRELVALLRCMFGNPYRPVEFDTRWRTETAVALATGIYADRAFDRLPILSDALEEAGCDHPDVLTHCRQARGVHARGCWVVDGVLGK
jgi:hypothetical protein